MITVDILNGPPGSGKDTIANELEKLGYVHLRFKTEVYKLTSIITGVPVEIIERLNNNRAAKDSRSPFLYPVEGYAALIHPFVIKGERVSLREMLIHVSENIVKPLLGQQYFGERAAEQVNKLIAEGHTKFVFSDGGFPYELIGFLARVKGVAAVNVRNVYREGCDFSGDSRTYVTRKSLVDGETLHSILLTHRAEYSSVVFLRLDNNAEIADAVALVHNRNERLRSLGD